MQTCYFTIFAKEHYTRYLGRQAQVLNVRNPSDLVGRDLIRYLEDVAQQLESATKKINDDQPERGRPPTRIVRSSSAP